MDAFSEILSGVKLNGAVFFRAEFSAPWGFSVPTAKVTAATLGLGAAHLLLYHLVVDGRAVIELADEPCIELKPGDVVVFPHWDPHIMSSSRAAVRSVPNYGITDKIKSRDLSPLRAGGGGDASRFVCGYMTCDPYLSRPILNGLPPSSRLISVRTPPGTGLRTPSCTWWKRQPPGPSAVKPCLRNSRRPCSSTLCGATCPHCPIIRWAGSRGRGTPSWGKASDCCMAALPTRGRSRILPTRSAFHGPL